jgi:predicted ATPase/DNA-binding SARP family transcriptional activator
VAGGVCRFGVLGPLVLERDGQAVPVPSGHQRSLLALLLLGGGVPLSRDRLINELWGERPPASAVSALHVHLSKLRSLLGGLLVLEAGGYALQAGGFEVDVGRFDALVEQARADPGNAGVLLRDALGLFRGEPLGDVASEGSVAQWRRGLEEKRLQALLLRIDADLGAGGAGELVGELEQLADQHPFEERVWGQLMLALYRAGRHADALEAYQRARRLFASELGLEPGELLAARQQQILDRDPALLAQQPVPAPAPSAGHARAAAARPGSNLPRPLTRLVGRERELAALAELVADPEVRLITLAGPGGVGKTRLLLELARRLEPGYEDGAVFVRLERLTDPALVASEIAAALARRDATDGPSADGLPTYLRDRELLIAVDNFEHLLAAAVLLAELLALAPKLQIAVSSRTALRIRGEQTFEVEPLELPGDESEDALAHSPAVQLFLQCALLANRKLQIDMETTRIVGGICRALDGLPLAIELAASRSHSLTPAQVAEQLAQPLAIGSHALRDLPDRQQTLQATIKWSYDLLSGQAQEVLRSASVFLGGFTESALDAVAGRPARAQLDELLEASLVRRQIDGRRYELLELVRAFALDELRASAQEAEVRGRHRRHFADHCAAASVAFDQGGAPGEIAAQLLADHANLRAALEDAIESGDQELALALAFGLRAVWVAGMLRPESEELVDRLLERMAIPGEKEVALLRAVAFIDYTPKGRSRHRRIAALAAEIGDQEALATATGNLFGQALNAHDTEEMKRLRPELLALIPFQTDDKALGWIHYYLALDAYVNGQFQSACEHAAQCAEKAEAIGHEFMLASAVATHLLSQSARDGVITQPELSEALRIMRRAGVQPLSAFALWLVARYAAAVDPEAADRWLAHAERIVLALDSELWPEGVLRDEALDALGIDDLAPLLERTPPLDHVAALAEAAAWLSARDPGEEAARVAMRPVTSATT